MTVVVTLNGFPIRYEIHGDGTPIVYTPGALYRLDRARPVAERLSETGLRVLLWDRPNTGGSGLLFEHEHLLRIWSHKLRDLLDYVGISSAYLAGVANGLLFSLHFAGLYPERVKGLILGCALTGDMDWWQAVYDASFLTPARIAEAEGMASALEHAGGRWGVVDWIDQFELDPEKRAQLLALDPHMAAEIFRSWVDAYAGPGPARFGGLTVDDLKRIRAPALIFSGPGQFYSTNDARVLNRALPRSELVVSPDYHGDRWDALLREVEEAGDFEVFAASFAERIDLFVRSVEQGDWR